MKKIVIVYHSTSGYTALLAEAIAQGARQGGTAEVELVPIVGKDIVDGRYTQEATLAKLVAADGILFGTPTFMGGPAAQFKAFADATGGLWYGRKLSGKLAGGFTTSGSPSGDKLSTLQYLSTLSNQHGMLWIGQDNLPSFYQGRTDGMNRLGSHLGVMGQNTNPQGATPVLDSGDALTGTAYGARFASFLARL